MKTLQIQKDLQRVLEREFMAPSYLDRFELDPEGELPKVSVIIPTYNRSPHPAREDSNPLGWCLQSLLTQRSGGLAEIVVVDDASTDHTKEVVEHFQKTSDVPISYFRNSENKGLAISRNIGVNGSENDFLMFVDDDCVFGRYFLFGANFTLSRLGEDVAALHSPVYHRRTTPSPVGRSEIGLLDLDKGVVSGNFDGFPIEFAEDLNRNFLDKELKIVKPIKIRNLAGIFLAKKEAIEKVGLFSEAFNWKNGYGVETDLALRLSESGYMMFFTPDPKFHCVHLKYGAKGREKPPRDLGDRLNQLINQSDVPRQGTGCRVDPEEWFESLMASTYFTLGMRSLDSAEEYVKRMEKRFVEFNTFAVGGVGTKIENKNERRAILDRAIKRGEELIRIQNRS